MLNSYRQNKINDKIEENKRKIRYLVKRSKLPLTVVSILLGLALAYLLFYKTSMFYNSHEVKFQSPIIIQPPFKILNREPSVKPKKEVKRKEGASSVHILSPLPPDPTPTLITKKETTSSQELNKIPVEVESVRTKLLAKTEEVFGAEHNFAMDNLITHESHYNPAAVNSSSGACGIFQFYPCRLLGDVEGQIEAGMVYIKARYGNPTLAWQFWLANGYY